jgi:hypothetical protein
VRAVRILIWLAGGTDASAKVSVRYPRSRLTLGVLMRHETREPILVPAPFLIPRRRPLIAELHRGASVRWAATFASTLMFAGCAGVGGAAMPQVGVKIAGANVPTAMGSYCWSSVGHGECADMASMEAVIQARGLSPIRVLANGSGAITFDRRPNSLDLMVGSDQAHLQAVPLSGLSFEAPSTPGRWEYLLSGRWDEGDVSWVFLVLVGAS